MIRTDFDISDESFEKETKSFYNLVDQYKKENILYPYLAFFIANKFLMNAMWEGTLTSHIQSAIDTLCDMDKFEININKLNMYLKYYNVKIISLKPFTIKRIKNVPR